MQQNEQIILTLPKTLLPIPYQLWGGSVLQIYGCMPDHITPTDEEIIIAVRTEDKERYAEIIRRYGAKLYTYARYLLKDEHDAQDVVQQTFISAYVNLQGFDTRRKFSSWIYRIAHNHAMNYLRRDKRTTELDETSMYPSTIDVEDEAVRQEIIAHAHSCLQQLPVLYREPLTLYYLDEKSYDEISDIMRIPTSTVGVRIRRAKAIMLTLCKNLPKKN